MPTYDDQTQTITFPAGGGDAEWLARHTNAQGVAYSLGSATVASSSSTVPAAPPPTGWRVESAHTDGETVYLAVDDVIPADATAIKWRKGGAGGYTVLDKVSPGIFTLTGFTVDTATDVELLFANASGDGDASAAKSVTARAASDTRFACWADGKTRHHLTAAATTAGATSSPTAGNVNKPIVLTGGGEAEVFRWATSKHADAAKYRSGHIGFSAPVSPSGGGMPTDNSVYFDPLGSARTLKPAEVEIRKLWTSLGETDIVVHGAGGMTTWRVNSLPGFNTGRLLKKFRFSATMLGGVLPDRRPFVIGPVDIVHNGGDPITITPDAAKGYALVSLGGAVLCVVSRPGIIPPLGASAADLVAVHGYNPAYTRRSGVYNFAADGWDETSANAAVGTDFWVRQTFEGLGLYAAGLTATDYGSDRSHDTGTNLVKVRFRKVGDANFYPAMDLEYDSKNHSGYPSVEATRLVSGVETLETADVMTAKHRGMIVYLEEGAQYEVQIKQGSTYRRCLITTWSHDVPRISRELGHLVGNVVVSNSGDIITVSRPGGSGSIVVDVSGGEWLELHSGSVQGNITINATVSRVIFTDIDRFGGTKREGVDIQDGAKDIRFIGGQSSGWGQLLVTGTGRVAVPRWGDRDGAEIGLSGSQFSHSIAVVGRRFGPPRYSANCWQELSDYTGDIWHPWGPSVVGRYKMQEGRLVVSDCTTDTDPYRQLEDWALPNGNKMNLGAVGGNTLDDFYGWNVIDGAADDGVELEGQAVSLSFLHNTVYDTEPRPGCGAGSAISNALPTAGPCLIAYNLIVFDPGDTARAQSNISGFGLKLQTGKGSNPAFMFSNIGRQRVYNNSMVTAGGGLRLNRLLGGSGTDILNVDIRNTAAFGFSLHDGGWKPTTNNNHSAATFKSRVGSESLANYEMDALFRPVGSQLTSGGEQIPNLTDGGAFYLATRQIGARMPA